jgi:phosphate transport system substrate-binding protein
MSKVNKVFISLFSLGLLASCGGSSSQETDTATSGHISLVADESVRPVIEVEEMVFESIYPKANIDIQYCSEADAIRLLLSDSTRVAILTRHLSDGEKVHFDNLRLTPRYSPIANDAIAIIMNRQATDTVLTLEKLTGILDGSISDWKQLGPGNRSQPIQVVFDNGSSGAIRYLRDSLLGDKKMASYCYAVKDNPSVVAHVESNPGSIGIIGMSWISDRDDSISHGFLKRIIVAGLVPKDPATAVTSVMQPYQAYVALKQYPLWRTVEMLNCTGRTGLGTGFASFIASDRGQRIILKAGLVPATAPIRLVQLNNE